jgi:hypothetical protein
MAITPGYDLIMIDMPIKFRIIYLTSLKKYLIDTVEVV